jgi:hypothetical protein
MSTNRTVIGAILALAAASCGPRVSLGDLESGGAGPPEGGPVDSTPSAGTGNDPLAVSWTDPTTAPDCQTSPLSDHAYTTESELDALLVGRWRRCKAAQIAGEDVGVEFTADGNYYALTFNAAHEVVRQVGVDYGGQWSYLPVGSVSPISHEPLTSAGLVLDGGYTDPPKFTDDPRQMRILFSPVLSVYVPLTP